MKTFVLFAVTLFFLVAVVSYADHSVGNVDAEEAFDAGDYQAAIHIWKEEAEKGELIAMEMLGGVYASGKVVARDYAESAKWHRLAAEKGSASSQYALGLLYYEGQGVERSLPAAYAWWLVSGASGNAGAVKGLREIEGKMSKEELEQAKQLVFELLQKLSR